jgi:hypothetical protein
MPLSPRQIAVRARESANLLVTTIQRGNEIPNFLRSYASEYQRARVIQEPLLYRDLVDTLGREALLNIASRIEGNVSRFLVKRASARQSTPVKRSKKKAKGKKSGGRKAAGKKGQRTVRVVRRAASKPRAADRAAIQLFRTEFLDALEQAFSTQNNARAEFLRDYELYRLVRSRSKPKISKKSSGSEASDPFRDRCALVLDASMFEQARTALKQLQKQLNELSGQVLRSVFSTKREN